MATRKDNPQPNQRRVAPRSIGKPITAKEAAGSIDNDWCTSSGINPVITTICDPGIASELADYVETGLPLSTSLDLAGVPEDTFRDWAKKASLQETPYVWAITLVKKAAAAYLYNTLLDLNMADASTYRKYLELLKLRDGRNWGGSESFDLREDDIDGEFL